VIGIIPQAAIQAIGSLAQGRYGPPGKLASPQWCTMRVGSFTAEVAKGAEKKTFFISLCGLSVLRGEIWGITSGQRLDYPLTWSKIFLKTAKPNRADATENYLVKRRRLR